MPVGLGPGHIVLDGDPGPFPQRGTAPNFRPISFVALGRKVGLDPRDIVLDGDPAPPPNKGAQRPIFGPCLLWPNVCMDQDATWYDGMPWTGQHCVRCGPSSTPRGTAPHQISAHVCCGQTAGWTKMALRTKVDLGPGRIVLHRDPGPHSQKRHSTQFSAHVYCDQTSVWIKMPLGTMVGLRRGNIVLDADPAPPPRGTAPSPKFRPMSIVCCGQTAGWTKMALHTKVGLSPGRIVLHGDPGPHSLKRQSPQFSAQVFCGTSYEGRPRPTSATAEHLLNIM